MKRRHILAVKECAVFLDQYSLEYSHHVYTPDTSCSSLRYYMNKDFLPVYLGTSTKVGNVFSTVQALK